MTGIAIVVYLNQKPMEPRERDYSYVASFYAFAIWIGLGVMSIYEFFKKKVPGTASAGIATLICLCWFPALWQEKTGMTMTVQADIRRGIWHIIT